MLTIVAGLGIVGLAVYAFWELRSKHPMTPPRLVENRAFLGLNVATLLVYAAASIMFFLLPFELVDGPYYLAMTVPVMVLGAGVVTIGILGWVCLGVITLGGTG
ncbi:hypothetical protein [Bradyrhizobium sp. LeoA1S1]